MTDIKQIILSVPAEVKGAWTAASRAKSMKLTDWIMHRVGVEDYDFVGFSLNVPALEPFEQYVRALSDIDAKHLLTKVKIFDVEQEDSIASVKIVRGYLEKQVAIAIGIASKDMFFEINAESLQHYSGFPDLTHVDLLEVICEAAIEKA